MNQPMCRGYGCNSSSLINAHIIPRGFARDIQKQSSYNLKISLDKVHRTQHGIYDPGILCADCDGKLGKLDDYALEVCRRFAREHKVRDGLFEMSKVNGDQFATFVLSVLWRASITSRVEFRSVSLGPYESEACEVIYGAKSLSAMAGYQLLLGRYQTVGRFNPEGNYTSPARLKIEGTNGWAFALHGFRIMAKLDRRPLPPMLRPAIVNDSTTLIGAFVSYHSTPEGKAMMEMKRADLARSSRHRAGSARRPP